MAEFSMLPWETQTGTGDGAFSYTQDQSNIFFRDFHIHNLATAGPLYGIDNQLEVTGVASPLAVNTGKGYCYGRYWNTASVNLAVTTPVINDTGGRVVLRTTWATNTTRLAVKLSADGVAAIPALTQTPGTTWEVSLASFVIDTSGDIWTDATTLVAGVTDTRCYVIGSTAGMIKLREVTAGGAALQYAFSEIQQDLTHLVVLIMSRSTSPAPFGKDSIRITINNDTGANYDYMRTASVDGVVPAAPALIAAATYITVLTDSTGSVANYASSSRIEINHYADSTFYKPIRAESMARSSGAVAEHVSIIGWHNSALPVTSIEFTKSAGTPLDANSIISLYGYK